MITLIFNSYINIILLNILLFKSITCAINILMIWNKFLSKRPLFVSQNVVINIIWRSLQIRSDPITSTSIRPFTS